MRRSGSQDGPSPHPPAGQSERAHAAPSPGAPPMRRSLLLLALPLLGIAALLALHHWPTGRPAPAGEPVAVRPAPRRLGGGRAGHEVRAVRGTPARLAPRPA